MSGTKRRVLGAVTGVTALLFPLAPLPIAVAQPAPPPPPFFPAPTLGGLPAAPGSYSATYFVIIPPSPATTDARGVNISTNADPAAAAYGMPGSKLGNSPHKPNVLTSASTRYGIQGGVTPPAVPSTGVIVGGGNQILALEDPRGQPPTSVLGLESVAPDTAAGLPASVLEDPTGQPPQESESSS